MIYEFDFDSTVRDIDYTKRAIQGMNRIVSSDEFWDMDSEAIFNYLCTGMEIVLFKDQLKRYLYERAGVREPFSQVSDEVYREIINDAFEENGAPHSFEPTSKKWTATMKSWLSLDSVTRQTIFLLGFGLRMSVADVSRFLVNVIKESDFNFYDKDEVIYWFCLKKQLGYLKAVELKKKYELLFAGDIKKSFESADVKTMFTEQESQAEEDLLMEYLSWLKAAGIENNNRARAYASFDELFWKSREIILQIYKEDKENGEHAKLSIDKITAADVEKILCCGIPMNENGNLKKMSASLLRKQFQQYRISRQRITGLSKRTLYVERFDLITLNFFLYSQKEYEFADQRCKAFVNSTNALLKGCGMGELYPVNPYETYILICLLSECPLAVYAEVWELSFQSETEEFM